MQSQPVSTLLMDVCQRMACGEADARLLHPFVRFPSAVRSDTAGYGNYPTELSKTIRHWGQARARP